MELSKEYKQKEIVRSVSFEVKQGQCFALLGPNGAGKSTTLNMVATLLHKTSGTILIDGINIDTNKEDVKKKIGIVFQDDVLDKELTIYKNLFYRGGLYFTSQKELHEQIDFVVEILSLQDILYKKYGTCSGGQKRLAQIGRALLPRPKLLILDEPTTGLDPVTRLMVWKTLNQLKNRLNITIFFTTHYLEEIANADEICIMDKGNVLLCGQVSHLLRKWKNSQTKELSTENLEGLYFHLLMKDKVQCHAENDMRLAASTPRRT